MSLMDGKLPSVESLFKDSWLLLKNSWKKLLIFNVVMLGIALVAVVVGIILAGLTIGGGAIALSHGSFDLAKIGALGGVIVVWVVILIAFALILGAVDQAGSILALTNRELSVEELLRKGLHYAPRIVGTSLLVMLLTIPAFILFLIPGLFVVLFLYFAPYSIVLSDRGVLDSLRRSIYLVKTNFWGMLIRALAVIGLFLLVGVIFSVITLATVKIPGLIFLVSLIRTIVNIALGWYVISYSITLYKQAESSSNKEGRGRLLWFVILSALGVIFAGLVVAKIVSAVNSNPEVMNFLKAAATNSASQSGSTENIMKQAYKGAFVQSCSQGGANKTICTCMADYMIKNYTVKQLQDMTQKYAETKVTPKELTSAAKSCATK